MKKLLTAATAALALTGTAALASSECDTFEVSSGGWASVYQLPGSDHTFHVMMTTGFVGGEIIEEMAGEEPDFIAWALAALAVAHVCDHPGAVATEPAYGLDPVEMKAGNFIGGYITVVHPSDIEG